MQGTIQTIPTWQDTGTRCRNNQEERDPAVLGTVNAVFIRQHDAILLPVEPFLVHYIVQESCDELLHSLLVIGKII